MLFFEKGETSRRRETMLSPTTRFVSESSARCAGMLRRNDTWRLVFFLLLFSPARFPWDALPQRHLALRVYFLFYFILFFSSARFAGMLSRNDTCHVGFRFGLGFFV